MRPIYHPHRDEITVQGILHALSDPVRVQIYSELLRGGCSQNCTTFVNVGATPLPKSTLSQHFKILREAGLIRSERKGVELQNRSRCEDLQHVKPMLLEILGAYRAEGGTRAGAVAAAPVRTAERPAGSPPARSARAHPHRSRRSKDLVATAP